MRGSRHGVSRGVRMTDEDRQSLGEGADDDRDGSGNESKAVVDLEHASCLFSEALIKILVSFNGRAWTWQ